MDQSHEDGWVRCFLKEVVKFRTIVRGDDFIFQKIKIGSGKKFVVVSIVFSHSRGLAQRGDSVFLLKQNVTVVTGTQKNKTKN